MPLTFSHKSFALVLPHLLKLWPDRGFRSERSAKRILASLLDATERGRVHVDPKLPRDELRTNGARVARLYSTPWKYTKYFQQGTDINRNAIKIRPGATIAISLEGAETTAYVNRARRLSFRGNPNYLKLDLNLNTETLPIFLERETKCQCRYCGTEPASDEVSCRSCGAPLPDC